MVNRNRRSSCTKLLKCAFACQEGIYTLTCSPVLLFGLANVMRLYPTMTPMKRQALFSILGADGQLNLQQPLTLPSKRLLWSDLTDSWVTLPVMTQIRSTGSSSGLPGHSSTLRINSRLLGSVSVAKAWESRSLVTMYSRPSWVDF